MRRSKKIFVLALMLSPALTLTGCQFLGQLLNIAGGVLANGNGDWGQMAGQFVGQAAPIAAQAIAQRANENDQQVGNLPQGGLRADRQNQANWQDDIQLDQDRVLATAPKDPELTGQDQI